MKLLQSLLMPIKKPPRLYLINASGRSWIGFHTDPALTPMFFGLYGAIFFGLPIVPLRFFLVSNPRDDGGIVFNKTTYNLHGTISLSGFSRIYGAGVLTRLILHAYARFIIACMLFALAAISYAIPLLGKLLKLACYIGFVDPSIVGV